MKIETASSATVSELWDSVASDVVSASTFEDAAQRLADALHGQFEESVAIARVFVTVPYGDLPAANKAFVDNLVAGANAQDALKPTTPVLSLVGTHGSEADWCDRRKSQGHVGIPLISADFVGAIPMIARLLRELGVPMDWADSHDSGVLVETIGHSAGLFFVENAATAKDQQDRNIIAAQDFVSAQGIKSVFGTGRAYDGGRLAVIVVFCRDEFSRDIAEHFLDLANQFHSGTLVLAEAGTVFNDA